MRERGLKMSALNDNNNNKVIKKESELKNPLKNTTVHTCLRFGVCGLFSYQDICNDTSEADVDIDYDDYNGIDVTTLSLLHRHHRQRNKVREQNNDIQRKAHRCDRN